MMKVTSKGKFNTSFGYCFVIEISAPVKVGEDIIIDGEKYRIKRIKLSPNPDSEEITIFV